MSVRRENVRMKKVRTGRLFEDSIDVNEKKGGERGRTTANRR